MTGLLLRLVIGALGLWLAAEIIPGIEVANLGTLLAAALLLGVANAVIRPVLVMLTLPITVLTLGLVPARDQCGHARPRCADAAGLSHCRILVGSAGSFGPLALPAG